MAHLLGGRFGRASEENPAVRLLNGGDLPTRLSSSRESPSEDRASPSPSVVVPELGLSVVFPEPGL